MTHLDRETVQRYADGELADAQGAEAHLRECASCANQVVGEMQLKRAVRDAARTAPPDVVRMRVQRRISSTAGRSLLPAAAAAVIAFIIGGLFAAGSIASRWSTRELADLHATILASASPVDVLSSDRHTVKPWFEGKIPFSFPIPELNGTPFRVIGGRVVYAHQQPAAYVMIGKGNHRLSLFVSRVTLPLRGMDGYDAITWRSGGLCYVLVGDVPRADLEALRQLF